MRQFYPVHTDRHEPQDLQEMARFLADWNLVQERNLQTIVNRLIEVDPQINLIPPDGEPIAYDGTLLHIPAQWEQTERVLVSWGRMYPKIYPMHAQLIEAISAVAICEVLVPSALWAKAITLYLDNRGLANTNNIQFSVLRTDDVWIRDYGAIMGITPDGQKVAVNAIYDVLPTYPQADDNGMVNRWAAYHGYPVQPLNLHTEGGNLWSDGQGTLIMSAQIFYSNPYYNRDRLIEYLHTVFEFEKVILTPRLILEETGHIDLLVKLANAETILISEASSFSTEDMLRQAKRIFERRTNAKGQAYQIFELPTPNLYLNWGAYTIRRAYTNSLTVNGRVLVPVFDIPSDDIALATYAKAMPDFDIIPIDSSIGINGGGAVHCMTKEVPL